MITIRKYEKNDWTQFRQLIMDQWEERYTYEAVSSLYLDPYWYKDFVVTKSDDYILLVAVSKKNKLYGFLLLNPDGEAVEIVYLYVIPSKRRTNVASKLMLEGEAWAKAYGYKEIFANSIVSNFKSHKLKLKLGYVNEMTTYKSVKTLY